MEIDLDELGEACLILNKFQLSDEASEALMFLINQGVLKIGQQNINDPRSLETLSYYAFKDLIMSNGALTGKDILSLCSSSRKLQSYCECNNQEIYRDLLYRDYCLYLSDLDDYFQSEDLKPSAKHAYAKFSHYPFMGYYLKDEGLRNYMGVYRDKSINDWRAYSASQWLLLHDEMINLLEIHYEKEDWFDDSKFKVMMMNRLTEVFFRQLSEASDEIINSGKNEALIIFGEDLAFALTSKDFERYYLDDEELLRVISIPDRVVHITRGFQPRNLV